MSAAAIQLLDQLRESGVENDRAVKIAEAFDLRVKEALEEAKTHSDRNRAEAEARAKAQFVSADEYHKRDRTLATRDDLNAAISEVRKEIRGIYHLLLGGFVTIVAGTRRHRRETLLWGLTAKRVGAMGDSPSRAWETTEKRRLGTTESDRGG